MAFLERNLEQLTNVQRGVTSTQNPLTFSSLNKIQRWRKKWLSQNVNSSPETNGFNPSNIYCMKLRITWLNRTTNSNSNCTWWENALNKLVWQELPILRLAASLASVGYFKVGSQNLFAAVVAAAELRIPLRMVWKGLCLTSSQNWFDLDRWHHYNRKTRLLRQSELVGSSTGDRSIL